MSHALFLWHYVLCSTDERIGAVICDYCAFLSMTVMHRSLPLSNLICKCFAPFIDGRRHSRVLLSVSLQRFTWSNRRCEYTQIVPPIPGYLLLQTGPVPNAGGRYTVGSGLGDIRRLFFVFVLCLCLRVITILLSLSASRKPSPDSCSASSSVLP